MKKLALLLLFVLPILAGCTCKPVIKEVVKEVKVTQYQYTWLKTEYKIWDIWFWYDNGSDSYKKVRITWYEIYCDNFLYLEEWCYGYVVWTANLYDNDNTEWMINKTEFEVTIK